MRFPLLFALGALLAISSASAQTIFLVRHAERADAGGTAERDPKLSAAGEARAKVLAQTLRDARIRAIYATEFQRTQATAKPLADLLKIPVTIVPAHETAALVKELKTAKANALVVGHSNTLPEIMQALGIANPPKLGENDYDQLFLLTLTPRPELLALHFR